MKKYTKEELLEMLDSHNLEDLKELSDSNPEVKKMIYDIRNENKRALSDILIDGLNVRLEIRNGNDDGMFEVIDNYLNMPISMSKKLTVDNKQTIIKIVDGFISTSKLSKERLELLSEKMNKICHL